MSFGMEHRRLVWFGLGAEGEEGPRYSWPGIRRKKKNNEVKRDQNTRFTKKKGKKTLSQKRVEAENSPYRVNRHGLRGSICKES